MRIVFRPVWIKRITVGQEQYIEFGQGLSFIVDEDGGGSAQDFLDLIGTDPDSPSSPFFEVNVSATSSTYDPWLDVTLTP